MKKRKPPVLLASLLVLLVGAVAFMNYEPPGAKTDGHGHDHAHDHGAEGGKALSQTSQPIPDQKEDMKQSLANAAAQGANQNAQAQVPDQPTVKVGTIERPRPNENAVAGQWYRSNARQVQDR